MALVGLLVLPLPGYGNLLENGSFDLFGNGKFETWVLSPPGDLNGGSKSGAVTQDPNGGFPDGGNAASFALAAKSSYHLTLAKRVSVNPGEKYRLTVHAKSSGGPVAVDATIRLFAAAPGNGNPKSTRSLPFNFEPATDWAGKVFDWEASPDEQLAVIHIVIRNRSNSPATVWLDEITLDPL